MRMVVRRAGGFSLLAALAVAVLVAVAPRPAHAIALYLQTQFYDGNACAGVFGHGFSNCRVGPAPGSPSIIKFDGNLGVDEISVNYPSIDGGEFAFGNAVPGNVSGTWTYAPDDLADPLVRFWSAKAGNGFYLFYYTPAMAPVGDLSDAVAVNGGEWWTPEGKDLSNLVFYDSGEFPPVVPEPATLVLLSLALAGLGVSARRRSFRS